MEIASVFKNFLPDWNFKYILWQKGSIMLDFSTMLFTEKPFQNTDWSTIWDTAVKSEKCWALKKPKHIVTGIF